MKKYLIIFGLIGFLFFIGYCVRADNEGRFTLVNKANQEIIKIVVEVCDQRFVLEELKQGETLVVHFMVKADSHYDIYVEFASGKMLTKKIGYVTSGLEINDFLVIEDDDVILESKTRVRR